MATSPVAQFLDALIEGTHWNLTLIADESGLSRAALSRMVNGRTQDPRASTLDALERGVGLPSGMLRDVTIGKVTVQAAVDAAAGRSQEPATPQGDLAFRLRSLETAVEQLQSDAEQWRRGYEEISAFVERLEGLAGQLEDG